MRTVGLLGGMSWQSTQIYYKLINEDVQARRGGLHSPMPRSLCAHTAAFAAVTVSGLPSAEVFEQRWHQVGPDLAKAESAFDLAVTVKKMVDDGLLPEDSKAQLLEALQAQLQQAQQDH